VAFPRRFVALPILIVASVSCADAAPISAGSPDATAGAAGSGSQQPESTAGSSAASGAAGTFSQAGGAGGGPASAGGAGMGGVPPTGGSAAAGAGANAGGSTVVGGSGATAGSAGGAAGAGSLGGSAPLVAVTVFLAGDSTVSTYTDTASTQDQAGWGQMLHEYLNPLAKVDNRAIGGRTARRFIDEGYLEKIWSDIASGDYLLVQFGTNDSNKTATYMLNGETIPYYLDPSTTFKSYLKQYIDGARTHGATPVLVTPPPRNSAYCTGGNGTGAYAQAMRELGEAEQIAVADLNQKSVAYLKAICPAPTPEDFFLIKSDNSVDGTHFQERGARKLAEFVTQGLSDAKSELARYAK
jgi:lysophospholipase L1-like esterase